MKLFKILILVLAVAGIVVFVFWDDLAGFYAGLNLNLPQIQKGFNEFVQEAERKIITPPPLIFEKDSQKAFLTVKGVIEQTNIQRAKYGLPPLKENVRLDVSAEAKTEDMFENQYFAHESPLGFGVSDLAGSAGYEYIIIGENLALGNFENDEVLVQAWMDSPGHRENILNNRYQEIGVSVQKGTFNGKTTWIAVQHFGLPLSACSQPNASLKTEIDLRKSEIDAMFSQLAVLEAEIEAMRPKSGPAYRQKVQEYNNSVAQYNALLKETSVLINNYNLQVKSFNTCIVSG